MKVLALRDELLDAVQYGQMTPDEAEAKAAQLGCAPLAEETDRALFDPMGETWWTPPMAVA
jgi:predicted RNA-binding protein associated with RNAse of E/G family